MWTLWHISGWKAGPLGFVGGLLWWKQIEAFFRGEWSQLLHYWTWLIGHIKAAFSTKTEEETTKEKIEVWSYVPCLPQASRFIHSTDSQSVLLHGWVSVKTRLRCLLYGYQSVLQIGIWFKHIFVLSRVWMHICSLSAWTRLFLLRNEAALNEQWVQVGSLSLTAPLVTSDMARINSEINVVQKEMTYSLSELQTAGVQACRTSRSKRQMWLRINAATDGAD